ncbi:methyltransferase regulatory domain-containing protein [Microvirga sp. BT689]|uniref:class I SAM-dependent methyltransferase n=1 Tax=Microvirga arvi TaxID=2778731 RepID=UPI001950A93A|nr:class I SAM-dependent methyltransferase [Microvirga arvi]MBM6582331.1 methyltransferase regulatory domain-containing protein [Microvirga arvi]
MANWSAGYVVDVEYTHGFYQELTPSLLGFLALLQGVQSPDLSASPLNYCELGCGQGFSTNLLAAANPQIQFHATDFNPGHIVGAQNLAQAAALKNVHFYDDSFAEFLGRNDLPDFDFICLHGIYSWVSPENRRMIVEFIRRKLKPGGLVYISYNTMPGWASMMPLRRLLLEHTAAQGSQLSGPSRVTAFLDLVDKLGTLDTRYFANHPKLGKRLEKLKSHNPNYIAHEYFNQNSEPFYFMDLAQDLADAKLTWVGPANALENLDEINLTKEQREFLAGIDNVALRQTTRDHIVDQQFRRDIFVKGAVRLSSQQVREKWLATRFALSAKGGKIPREVRGLRHAVKLHSGIYDPLIAALEKGPRTLREIMAEPVLAQAGFNRLIQALTILVALGVCHPGLPEHSLAERKLQTDRFNRAVADESRFERKFSYFASPVTGGGIAADRISQLMWLSLHEKEPDMTRFVGNVLSAAGQRLLKDGKPLNDAEHEAELRQRVAEFEQNTLGVWTSLGLGAPPQKSPEQRRLRA